MSAPVLRLKIVEYNNKKITEIQLEDIKVFPKSPNALIQEVWDRFKITQEGDRELIAQALSSPSKYNSLAFFMDGPTERSYRIELVALSKADFFPKRPIQKEKLLKQNKTIAFEDRALFGPIFNEKGIAFEKILEMSAEFPELAALYNAESFSCFFECDSNDIFTRRVFKVE